MSDLTLYIGNRNYSSWSMRVWLALKHTGAYFTEVLVPLGQPETAAKLREVSPTGKVPVLRQGTLVLWESLAIIDYLAEQFPSSGLWPAEDRTRAVARCASAEMHAGFLAMRTHMPLNVRASHRDRGRPPEVNDDINRISALWEDLRLRFGSGGPFLFGKFSAADCMFAPVVSRFTTYGVTLSGVAGAYADAIRSWPAWLEWVAAAGREPYRLPKYE